MPVGIVDCEVSNHRDLPVDRQSDHARLGPPTPLSSWSFVQFPIGLLDLPIFYLDDYTYILSRDLLLLCDNTRAAATHQRTQ